MESNQGWSDDPLQLRQRGTHSVKETDMFAVKIDLLFKKFEEYSQDKTQMQTLQALEVRMTWRSMGMLDIRVITARKPKKKLCISMATTTDFIHKEVRGGINHAHTTKKVMEIQILSIPTNLP